MCCESNVEITKKPLFGLYLKSRIVFSPVFEAKCRIGVGLRKGVLRPTTDRNHCLPPPGIWMNEVKKALIKRFVFKRGYFKNILFQKQFFLLLP